MKKHVILVEDERDLADLVSLHLTREGFKVSSYADGLSGWAGIERDLPDLMILDLMLPGIDGFEICRRARRDERLARTPILMLTARGEDVDMVTGLELGADDYVVKPYSLRVLVARCRALLRRNQDAQEHGELVRVGPLEIDSGRHEVRLAGEPLVLTHTEFRVLRYLAKKPGRVRSRNEILEALGDANVLDRTVDVHVAALRKKLGEHGYLLETVRGVGYRMTEADRAEG